MDPVLDFLHHDTIAIILAMVFSVLMYFEVMRLGEDRQRSMTPLVLLTITQLFILLELL